MPALQTPACGERCYLPSQMYKETELSPTSAQHSAGFPFIQGAHSKSLTDWLIPQNSLFVISLTMNKNVYYVKKVPTAKYLH